jgi:hypothetical protein
LIAGEYVGRNVTGLFHIVVGPLMHGALDSDIDQVKTEVFVFLAVLYEKVKVRSNFWLNVLDREQFEQR